MTHNERNVPVDSGDFCVPDDLTELDQWVPWRYEKRNGKWTKVPYRGDRQNEPVRMRWARGAAISNGTPESALCFPGTTVSPA